MTTSVTSRRDGYSLDADLMPIINGDIPLPNTEEIEPLRFLNNLASGGHSMTPHWGWALRHIGGRKQWAQFFMSPVSMGGQGTFNGSGYAVIYGNVTPAVLRFAICKHEKVDGIGANPRRGWHPGSCRLCGLNMTVDSSD